MHRGGAANRMGLTPDASRFYERSALLPGPARTGGGYRQSDENHIETVEFTALGLHCSNQSGLASIEMIPRAIRRARPGQP
jgi:DNA-binding transcriptional MerR regulator